MGFGKIVCSKQRVQDTLVRKLGVIECDSGNVEVQWNNIKECVLDTLSDLVGKIEKRARKPWITQEIISKMDERRKWKTINTEEGRKNYRWLWIELKRFTHNAKKEYLENICKEIMEFQRTRRYDLMYMKTKELGWRENQGIRNIGIEDSQGNRIVEESQVLKIWENYIRNYTVALIDRKT